MKNVLVLGAGRTSAPLISYLLNISSNEDWFITVGDYSLGLAQEKVKNHPCGKAIKFNIFGEQQKEEEISSADLVISILPASLHILAARQCLISGTNFINASYTSDEMTALDEDVKKAGLIFLNEMGIDPGIDHMDAKLLIDNVRGKGGEILSFKSYGGGLVSPRSDNNCWGYKFTWSPMNVVLAGTSGGRYLKDGKEVNIDYENLFLNTEQVEIPSFGMLESYPNRDATIYLKKYGIEEVKNIYRGSLRKPGFSKAWNAIIKLGLTDNKKIIHVNNSMTYRNWMHHFLPNHNGKSDEQNIRNILGAYADEDIIEKIMWLNLFSDEKINLINATSAEILLALLGKKWFFENSDSDMAILQTEIVYNLNSQNKKLISTLIINGEGIDNTAMAQTVGIPLGIGAKLILQNKIKERGVIIPVYKDIYEPVLSELKEFGISFKEEEKAF